jgi:uncharacterized protein YjbI with pentapeptide repeats
MSKDPTKLDNLRRWKPTDQELKRVLARHCGWRVNQFGIGELPEHDEYLEREPTYGGWVDEARSHPERADLSGADLSRAKLSGADLSYVELHGADLSRANLIGAVLAEANLRGANLRGANLRDAFLFDANLSGADLSYTELSDNADLTDANLSDANLSHANLTRANLTRANLTRANLTRADLSNTTLNPANVSGADLSDANLSHANLYGAYLIGADLTRANLTRADLTDANLSGANLSDAKLFGANLSGANLSDTDLRNAQLTGATLVGSRLVRTLLQGTTMSNCPIYGISAWDVIVDDETKQLDLIVTPKGEPVLSVDNLEVAQFVYLLVNNEKIRHVIDTITSKTVLILGRFTAERKRMLDALRDELRKRDYVPILFDFEKPSGRDLTETVTLLARMARFIIADITDAAAVREELQLIARDLPSVPIQPLLLAGTDEYVTFEHPKRYPWVLPTYRYENVDTLLEGLASSIIAPAEVKAAELRLGALP